MVCFITIIKNNKIYFFFKNTIGSDIPSLLTESYWKKMFNQHLLSDSLFKGSVREKFNISIYVLGQSAFQTFLLIDVTDRSKTWMNPNLIRIQPNPLSFFPNTPFEECHQWFAISKMDAISSLFYDKKKGHCLESDLKNSSLFRKESFHKK